MFDVGGKTITAQDLGNIITKRDTRRFAEMQAYYEGRHSIQTRKQSDASKPNNLLVNNYPGYISAVNVGYFLGKPVTYSAGEDVMDDAAKQDLQAILDYNDEQDENIVLAKSASIKGRAYELLYLDETSEVRFNAVPPEEMIVVYDDRIVPAPLFAVRYWTDPAVDGLIRFDVYTPKEIISGTYDTKAKSGTETKREPHPFGDVPVVEYLNNDERQGDFEKVLTLIDAYDRAQSDTANDFEYFTDAYLVIRNMSATTSEDISKMKAERVLLLSGDGSVEWLTKPSSDVAAENFKNRLQQDIHSLSLTPNLTDESFAGNLSGVALQYKLWGLEQVAAQKERKFKRGLQRRIELIFAVLKVKGKDYDWRSVGITFTRNIPANLADAVDLVSKLKGIVSDETLLSQLPFISDPQKELEKLRGDEGDAVDLDAETDDITPGEEAGAGQAGDALASPEDAIATPPVE